jgi:ankyrin repeat protein
LLFLQNETALHGAVRAPQFAQECVGLLLDSGADLNAHTTRGDTPIMLAG